MTKTRGKQHVLNPFEGRHNQNLEASNTRLVRGGTYKDLSTVCIIPTRGLIPAKVVQSWMSLMTPMNGKFYRFWVENMEVADAYNSSIETLLNSELGKWKYVLTLEEDNVPQPDGLLQLYESIAKYDVVSGLYWTKGELGQPMIYGDPKVFPKNFIPQIPIPDAVQECNGLGMGFTLFKMDIFRKVPKPWFKTVQSYVSGQGVRQGTQDLYFFENAAKYGYRFASDNRVKVGHWDQTNQMMW